MNELTWECKTHKAMSAMSEATAATKSVLVYREAVTLPSYLSGNSCNSSTLVSSLEVSAASPTT